ncbi:MAG: hypothetical protein OEZ58_09140 [Gammaproteobacteria bacterium]|nr:hypothetical protein [Gammaproteobacteria bacterium]
MKKIIPIYVLFFSISCLACTAFAESSITALQLKAEVLSFAENKRLAKQYTMLQTYDVQMGRNPEKANLHVSVAGNAKSFIVVDIIPVVGLTGWATTEGITNTQLLSSSKTPLASVLRLEQSVELSSGSSEAIFKIDLASIIEQFTQKYLWPVELHFNASLFPSSDESSLADNYQTFVLNLFPPD